MSALVQMYDSARRTGLGHKAAVSRLARRLGVDADTVARQLARAAPRRFSTR